MAEKEIYEPLERWVKNSFSKYVSHSEKMKHVEITITNSYFRAKNRKNPLYPDVSAIDRGKNLIVFECKAKDPLRSKQLIAYSTGTNYLYSVVREQTPYLSQRQKMLKSIGVGLITFRKDSKTCQFALRHESKDHKGILVKSNMEGLKRATEEIPRIIIFPHQREYFPTKKSLKDRIKRCRKGDTYYHRQRRILPPGSIVLFAYGDEIAGQAVIRRNRKPTKGERREGKKKGYKPLFVFEPFPELVSIFPRSVKFKELGSLPSFQGKQIHSVVRNYPYISEYEYLFILNRALSTTTSEGE